MKLWVDDLRDAPDESWEVARTCDDAILALGHTRFDKVSLDHDLSTCEETGFDIAVWMVRKLVAWPRVIAIYTSNPLGGEQMYSVL